MKNPKEKLKDFLQITEQMRSAQKISKVLANDDPEKKTWINTANELEKIVDSKIKILMKEI